MLQIVRRRTDLTAAVTEPTVRNKTTVTTRATIRATAKTMATIKPTAKVLKSITAIREVGTANQALKDLDRTEARIKAMAISRTDVAATAAKVRVITIKTKDILKAIIPIDKVTKDKLLIQIDKDIIRDRIPDTRVVRVIRDQRGVEWIIGVNVK